LGLTASILSGSRGGWLAVPLLVAALLWQARSELTTRRMGGIAVALVCIVALSNALADGMPTKRTSASVTSVSDYRPAAPASESAASSEGARIEAWRSALHAFEQRPVTGLGWGNLSTHFDREVALGLRNERIANFEHAHNQLLGAAANGGVIGLAMTLLLFIVPLVTFLRALGSGSARRRTLGATGVMVLGAYAVFGLTEAVLENLVPVTVLAVLVAALCSEIDGVPDARRPAGRHAASRPVSVPRPRTFSSTADRRTALFRVRDRRLAR
jgi:O-antigen ligase